ncbi:hypothetical protein TNCT_622451 [Trichonephila clavata]|uniref:Uncharacterized protein n=1 Tax=Trichonephila clavata TaxID=2740835 RepID=A0A8X6GTN3_TRICU|nr:hypothetical protein TNCT_622451 [Trichonephila clavata]
MPLPIGSRDGPCYCGRQATVWGLPLKSNFYLPFFPRRKRNVRLISPTTKTISLTGEMHLQDAADHQGSEGGTSQ